MFEHVGERRWRASAAASVRAKAVSVIIHVALLALLIWQTDATSALVTGGGREGPGSAFGTGPTDGPAGGGGGGEELVTYVDLAPTPPAAPEPEPEPEVVEVPPVEEVPVPEIPLPGAVEPRPQAPVAIGTPVTRGDQGGAGTGGPGTGPGSGGGTGGGTGTGIGSGVGPGTGGGGGEGDIHPPVPSAVFLPPPAPPSMRGKTVVLVLTVDTRGRVQDVEFPSTGDRGFDSRLRRTAEDWRFQPARTAAGRAVLAQTEVSFSF